NAATDGNGVRAAETLYPHRGIWNRLSKTKSMSTGHGTGRSPLLRRPTERIPVAPLAEPRVPSASAADSLGSSTAPVRRGSGTIHALRPESPILRQRGRAHAAPAQSAGESDQTSAGAQAGFLRSFAVDSAADSAIEMPTAGYWMGAAVVSLSLFLWLY